MRAIKFRAWLKYEDTMVRVIDMNMWTDDQNSHYIECENIFNEKMPDYSRSEIELMQYTGLKDMVGKEIYEGDVVCYSEGKHKAKGRVVFNNGAFIIEWEAKYDYYRDDLYHWQCKVNVVGNIYENPELLEVNHE